ncbi:DUF427 domain-containing protein [Thermosynechococcus sp.]|uniref:DUF427 domain-containing protein n=1 Tax=Thermosynechococcus sp. TaxID=2814275 RepID=UPI00391CA5F6
MQRIPPALGQESVWDYPRPPRVEPTSKHLRVVFNGVVIADTRRGQRVLETSHPPVYYFPPEDVQLQYLVPSPRQTFCEWKGQGAYYHVKVGDRQAENAAWYYPQPTPAFAAIRNYIAFYAGPMDECTVDSVVVMPQPGGFYGGWITPDIVGPFKGAPGTWGW